MDNENEELHYYSLTEPMFTITKKVDGLGWQIKFHNSKDYNMRRMPSIFIRRDGSVLYNPKGKSLNRNIAVINPTGETYAFDLPMTLVKCYEIQIIVKEITNVKTNRKGDSKWISP